MKNTDPRVDAYIRKAAPFARPILTRLRSAVHAACPDAEETLKWGCPSFVTNGRILCGMAAFKEHTTFGFWHKDMEPVLAKGAHAAAFTGTFGRITNADDLPPRKTFDAWIKRAVALNEMDTPARPRPARRRAPAAVPADLAAALKKNRKAAATFEGLSPSHRREYIEWITEAKRDETRQKRLATTLEWLEEGKSRNWKYENC